VRSDNPFSAAFDENALHLKELFSSFDFCSRVFVFVFGVEATKVVARRIRPLSAAAADAIRQLPEQEIRRFERKTAEKSAGAGDEASNAFGIRRRPVDRAVDEGGGGGPEAEANERIERAATTATATTTTVRRHAATTAAEANEAAAKPEIGSREEAAGGSGQEAKSPSGSLRGSRSTKKATATTSKSKATTTAAAAAAATVPTSKAAAKTLPKR